MGKSKVNRVQISSERRRRLIEWIHSQSPKGKNSKEMGTSCEQTQPHLSMAEQFIIIKRNYFDESASNEWNFVSITIVTVADVQVKGSGKKSQIDTAPILKPSGKFICVGQRVYMEKSLNSFGFQGGLAFCLFMGFHCFSTPYPNLYFRMLFFNPLLKLIL